MTSEDEMNELLNQDAKRGTQKKKEGANTQHDTPGPERANPEKSKGKEKSGGSTDTEQDQRRGGRRRKRLNQPNTARTYTQPQHATEPTYLGREETHEIGDQWGTSWCNHKKEKQDSVPRYLEVVRCSTCWDRGQVLPQLGINGFQVPSN